MTTRLTTLAMALCMGAGTALAQDAPAEPSNGKAPDLTALIGEPVLEPGTKSGAKDLRATLEPYLSAEAFESGVVSIAPVDEGYRLTFALQKLVDSIPEAEGMAIEVSDYSMLVSEQPDGLWFIATGGPLSFSYDLDMPPDAAADASLPQSIEYDIEALDMAGYYDPAIATYARLEGFIGTARQVQTSAEGTVTAVTEPIRMRMTGRAGSDGTADAEIIQFGGAARQEMDVPLDPADPQSSLPVVISNGATESVTIGKGLKSLELLRLYAVGLQLMQNPERAGSLEAFKSALQAALPVWTNLANDTKVAGFTVDLGSFGSGQVGSLDVDMDLDGINEAGDYTMAYDLSDISVTSPFVPEWANALIPTRMSLRLNAENVDLMRPAAIAISDLRLDADAPISDEAGTRILDLFRTSQASYGLRDSVVQGRDYRIAYSAEFDAGDVLLDIEAEGIDAVIASLQEASQQYPEALQGVSFLQIAKGFGRPTGDDALQWTVAVAGDGSVTVNGAMLKGPDVEPLPGTGISPRNDGDL